MEDILHRLLDRIERLSSDCEEIYDTVCRERMSEAIFYGFVKRTAGYELPREYGMHTEGANRAVHEALSQYVQEANTKASELGLNGFHERLTAFQNPDIQSSKGGCFYDDFFGCIESERFNDVGDVIGDLK